MIVYNSVEDIIILFGEAGTPTVCSLADRFCLYLEKNSSICQFSHMAIFCTTLNNHFLFLSIKFDKKYAELYLVNYNFLPLSIIFDKPEDQWS